MALLLCSSNILNCRPKTKLQLLVVVELVDGNAGSWIQSAQDKWAKYLVMVSLIIIAMVCDLNGLSDFTLALSVRV